MAVLVTYKDPRPEPRAGGEFVQRVLSEECGEELGPGEWACGPCARMEPGMAREIRGIWDLDEEWYG